MNLSLNDRAQLLIGKCLDDHARLRITARRAERAHVLDFGVEAPGGIEAGLLLARICMSDLATVALSPVGNVIRVPQIFVHTDQPLHACLLSQYAGWKVATDDYFAMASGPMRALAASEALFAEFSSHEAGNAAVGILESGQLPTDAAIDSITSHLPPGANLTLAVAPTASQAGNLQVVARSVETTMHKLHEIGFPLESVRSGSGVAPLPPVAKNDLEGIGRTNDAILYGATVNLYVDCEDTLIEELGPQTPSVSSSSHGQQFLDLFKAANHDFYALDKALFSPAIVVFHNVSTGNSFEFGKHVPQLLHESFGM